ncbi:MAG: four helix bundle protein [Candidatus Sungbacteria bacterium]|nr:four helix bundle protein [Candidatus Sungbacteria bacterium]
MATIRRFEDLHCWKKARELTRAIYNEFKDLKDYGFKDQIQRAAVSVISNIAEGFESGTRQEFLNYLYIAKGSAGEVRAQLYAAVDIGYLNIEKFKYLNALAVECSQLIDSFIKSLKSSPVGGLQFKKEKSKFQRQQEEFEAWAGQRLAEERARQNGI